MILSIEDLRWKIYNVFPAGELALDHLLGILSISYSTRIPTRPGERSDRAFFRNDKARQINQSDNQEGYRKDCPAWPWLSACLSVGPEGNPSSLSNTS